VPDHLHAVWRLPDGDAELSLRWRLIEAGGIPPLRCGGMRCVFVPFVPFVPRIDEAASTA
jgi:hypothetical protein